MKFPRQTRFAAFVGASLDGYIARPDGGLDWLKPFEGEEHGYREFFASIDVLAIGRGTYDTVLGFPDWPYEGRRVVVCTRRPADATHGEEFWSGTPRELAERLEREGAKRVYVDGGALVSSFLREDLIDELTVTVVPIILGDGRPLFARPLPEIALQLLHAQPFSSGLVQLRYRRG